MAGCCCSDGGHTVSTEHDHETVLLRLLPQAPVSVSSHMHAHVYSTHVICSFVRAEHNKPSRARKSFEFVKRM